MRWRCMNSLAKLLLDSNRVAALVGPNTGHPRRVNSSTTPWVKGISGPITVRSGRAWRATATSESTLLMSAARHSASAAMPPFPGAQYTWVTWGLPQFPDECVLASAASNDQNLHDETDKVRGETRCCQTAPKISHGGTETRRIESLSHRTVKDSGTLRLH